jgi:hypothetical protein
MILGACIFGWAGPRETAQKTKRKKKQKEKKQKQKK